MARVPNVRRISLTSRQPEACCCVKIVHGPLTNVPKEPSLRLLGHKTGLSAAVGIWL